MLESGETSSIQVYPNPATDRAMLKFTSSNESEYTITLMEMTGNVVYTTSHHALQGDNNIELDLSRFAKGIYMIQLSGQGGQQMTWLVIE